MSTSRPLWCERCSAEPPPPWRDRIAHRGHGPGILAGDVPAGANQQVDQLIRSEPALPLPPRGRNHVSVAARRQRRRVAQGPIGVPARGITAAVEGEDPGAPAEQTRERAKKTGKKTGLTAGERHGGDGRPRSGFRQQGVAPILGFIPRAGQTSVKPPRTAPSAHLDRPGAAAVSSTPMIIKRALGLVFCGALVAFGAGCQRGGGETKIDKIEPPQGTTAGGEEVTIAGDGFTPGKTQAEVRFGRKKSEIVTIASPNKIKVVTPVGDKGPTDVTVAFDDGRAFKIRQRLSLRRADRKPERPQCLLQGLDAPGGRQDRARKEVVGVAVARVPGPPLREAARLPSPPARQRYSRRNSCWPISMKAPGATFRSSADAQERSVRRSEVGQVDRPSRSEMRAWVPET